jgi:hypothetical protein
MLILVPEVCPYRRRRKFRYWPPFSLPDSCSPLQHSLWSHSNPRGDHSNRRGCQYFLCAIYSGNVEESKWRVFVSGFWKEAFLQNAIAENETDSVLGLGLG